MQVFQKSLQIQIKLKCIDKTFCPLRGWLKWHAKKKGSTYAKVMHVDMACWLEWLTKRHHRNEGTWNGLTGMQKGGAWKERISWNQKVAINPT